MTERSSNDVRPADNIRVKEAEKRRKDKKLGRRQAQLEAEAAEAAAFFSEATGDALGAVTTFHEMNLSRPLLKVRSKLTSTSGLLFFISSALVP